MSTGSMSPALVTMAADTMMSRRKRKDNFLKLSSRSREFSVRSGVLPWHTLLFNSRSLLGDRRD